MYLEELFKSAKLVSEPSEQDVIVIPKGIQSWADYNMVISREDWDRIYVGFRGREPDIEATTRVFLSNPSPEFLRRVSEERSFKTVYAKLREEVKDLTDTESIISEEDQQMEPIQRPMRDEFEHPEILPDADEVVDILDLEGAPSAETQEESGSLGAPVSTATPEELVSDTTTAVLEPSWISEATEDARMLGRVVGDIPDWAQACVSTFERVMQDFKELFETTSLESVLGVNERTASGMSEEWNEIVGKPSGLSCVPEDFGTVDKFMQLMRDTYAESLKLCEKQDIKGAVGYLKVFSNLIYKE